MEYEHKTVNCAEMVQNAEKGRWAVPHVNINTLETLRVVLGTAQQMRSPMIVAYTGKGAEMMGGFRTVCNMSAAMLDDLSVTVPVAVHLDHGTYEDCLRCIDAGFNSVMFDGSKLPFEENLDKTLRLMDICAGKGISLEAELGTIGRFTHAADVDGEFAAPEECLKMKNTGIAMLAVGIGNKHGHYPPNWPGLSFETLSAIKEAVGEFPLVLHGGSGIPNDQITKAISMGIAKININTECQVAYMKGVRAYIEAGRDQLEGGHVIRKMLAEALVPVEAVVRAKITAFGSANRA